MNKEFVPYDIALAMKELGFDEYCFMFYNSKKDIRLINKKDLFNGKLYKNSETTSTMTPLYQQAFRWFRENYGMYSHIKTSGLLSRLEFTWVSNGKYGFLSGNEFKTYEEAELECLRKLIEIVKDNK